MTIVINYREQTVESWCKEHWGVDYYDDSSIWMVGNKFFGDDYQFAIYQKVA
jgi:hypothetical protein